MALKSKYSSIDALSADLKRSIQEIQKPANMKKIGDKSAELIKVRTRLGYGVEQNDGVRQRLKPLKESTIAARKEKTLSGQTTPKRSNLTETGQLLDSIQPYDIRTGEVQVGPRGLRETEALKNETLAKYVSDAGRPFNNHSKSEIRQLQQLVEEMIEKLLK